MRPLPWQTGQVFSPVPGVPAGASSPGFIGAAFGACTASRSRAGRGPAGGSELDELVGMAESFGGFGTRHPPSSARATRADDADVLISRTKASRRLAGGGRARGFSALFFQRVLPTALEARRRIQSRGRPSNRR